jgi:hypothetical protein
MVQMEPRWSPDGLYTKIWLGLLQIKVHMDSMWTPNSTQTPHGVQEKYMGEGKVLPVRRALPSPTYSYGTPLESVGVPWESHRLKLIERQT